MKPGRRFNPGFRAFSLRASGVKAARASGVEMTPPDCRNQAVTKTELVKLAASLLPYMRSNWTIRLNALALSFAGLGGHRCPLAAFADGMRLFTADFPSLFRFALSKYSTSESDQLRPEAVN